MHHQALFLTLAFTLALPVYVLAAIHVGLTRRGRVYLSLAAVAFAAQMVLSFIAMPPLGCLLFLPVIVAGICAVVFAKRPRTPVRLQSPSSRRWFLWTELLIIPATVALVWVLVAQINSEYVPDEPNPERSFDSSEGWDRLDAVIAASLPALEAVEGFNVTQGPHDAEMDVCEDGAAWDEEWVDLRIVYYLGDLEPGSEISLEYMDQLKAAWAESGYTLTGDSSAEAATGDQLRGYGVSAADEEGVTVAYTVGYGQAKLEARTGCILKVGDSSRTSDR